MAGLDIALPEPFQGEDAKSWLKYFEVCATANKWSDEKSSAAESESLSEAETCKHEHLKMIIIFWRNYLWRWLKRGS